MSSLSCSLTTFPVFIRMEYSSPVLLFFRRLHYAGPFTMFTHANDVYLQMLIGSSGMHVKVLLN